MLRRPFVFRSIFSFILFPTRNKNNDGYRRQRTNNDLKKFIHNTIFKINDNMEAWLLYIGNCCTNH